MSRPHKWNLEDPEIRHMIERLKFEIAQEYGINIPLDGYWGRVASKDLGTIGAQLQKRLPLLLEHQKRTKSEKKRVRKKP
ncbi:alpha/beta-type small acid-soluble spore protein [Tumebacillus sp. ITR2]|uniref:Alpha/beta-type small acid-soluble spore protein n=1 Tax=Tumebacillus amylolyticus TaxID=2801339 RepID=A0ABS1J4Y9_9BACL|nr:alpha/beta-type small acid-soluble spore protein [Tumebacillus amylolyticus]MBL0385343.1 alpha/beta-type small acid-soluble spore protein [Tumebacillus amylolyticus]